MEELVVVQPTGCEFELEVPARIRTMYTGVGYERLSMALFERACSQADVVVDIGAHVGLFSLAAAHANPSARVISVEASPENVAVIARNVARVQSIEVIGGFFGDTSGSTNFEITEASDNCGINGHPQSRTLRQVEVVAVTGTDLAISDDQRVVIKIDVEGFEPVVLAGLERIIECANDIRVLVEFNPTCLRAAGVVPRDSIAWWLDRNFRIFMVDDARGTWSEIHEASDALEEQLGRGFSNLFCLRASATRSVAAVMHSGALSGAERSHVELVEDLVTSGWMVHTVVPGHDNGLISEIQRVGGSAVVIEGWPWWVSAVGGETPTGASWSPFVVHEPLIRALVEAQPDVVLSQTVVVAQGAIAACALGLPHVWYLHELALPEHHLQLPRPAPEVGAVLAALSDQVISISEAVGRHFFPDNWEAVDVVYSAPRGMNAVERAARVELRDRDGRPWRVGVIGSLQVGKGHADVIAALSLLMQRGIDVRLHCIGTGRPADVERLQNLAVELGVSDRVILVGQIADRTAVYADLDAVVMASPNEGFSRIPFEVADAGLPFIYVNGGGTVEAMVPNETGIAYGVGDIGALADAMESLAADPDLGRALAAQAKLRVDAWRADPERLLRLQAALSVERSGGADGLLREMIGAIALRASVADASVLISETLARERDAVVLERDGVIVERDSAALERDTTMAERDALRQYQGELEANLNAIQTSRVWRWTTPYRRWRSRT